MDADAAHGMTDLERIKQLKAKYCRYVDTKQWDRLRAIFAPGVRFEGLGSAPTGASLDDFIKGISTRMKTSVSIHHCHTPEIEFTGADSARGVWAMMDFVDWPSGPNPRETPDHRGFFGFGYYEEEYVRTPAGWRIAFLRLTRMRVDPIGHEHPLPRPVLISASKDWLPSEQ